MATPTAMASKHPATQAVATPPVTTPFSASHGHPAFSPHGPRSVGPSPQQVKKSPANSNTLYGYPSVSAGGHPTNSSFGAGYDSPSAAMALGGVPNLADLGLDAMGGGVPGMGALGALGRGDEDERKRRLGLVLDILKTNKGRLSEAGIERLARRVGFECLWEAHMGSGGSTRTLIIAGSALALDIDFSNNIVKKVALSFPDSGEIVTRHAEKAGNILLRDLEFKQNESPLTKMLDRFAANLERLATLDNLSLIPGLNCYEAISGIFESLQRLHEWEVERLKEQEDTQWHGEEAVDIMAMCMKSGKPVMHTRDRLGLSLDYWREKRRLRTKVKKCEEPKTWSLLVECAPMPHMGYPPVRASERWISPDIQKENPPAAELFLAAEGGPVLDWVEPDNTLLPNAEAHKVDAMEGIDQPSNQKFPEVIFVAKFDPPLVVPYGLAMQIHNLTNAPLEYQTHTYDGLMFPYGPEDKIDVGEGRTITNTTTVPIFGKDGEISSRIHKNELIIEKIDYGYRCTELPFSHPRQLVEALPILRQYAFLSTLLSKAFSHKPAADSTPETKKLEKQSKTDEFKTFTSQSSTHPSTPFPVDIALTIGPLPRLQVIFPFKNRTANIMFDIKLNGIVEVVSQNMIVEVVDVDRDGPGGEGMKASDLGTMLEITEDLGIWVEFLRRRFG